MSDDTPRSTVRAIETRYAGHRFRSRLEARWAVFFDVLGIDWMYEPEGYELDNGKRYLPDFFLPATQTWVEVKGTPSAIDWDTLAWAVEYGGGLPHVYESLDTTRGVLVLCDIPRPGALHVHPVIQHHEGVVGTLCGAFTESGYFALPTDHCPSYYWPAVDDPDPEFLAHDMTGFMRPGPFDWGLVDVARTAARSARFEHGEAPRISAPRIHPPRLDPPRA